MVDAHGVPRPTQIAGVIEGKPYGTMVTGQKVRWVLDLIRGTEFAGRTISAYEVIPTGAVHEIVFHEAEPGDPHRDLTELREQILDLGTRGETVSLKLIARPLRRVVFDTGEIPGFGWSCFTVADGDAPTGPVTGTATTLANEHVSVEIDEATGTYTIAAGGLRAAGLGLLVNDGDGGDTYNYSPPAEDRVVDRPDAVRVTAIERGPVRARVRVDSDYTWPAYAIGDLRSCSARSDETVAVTVSTVLELRSGERFLRVSHELDNQARDHRLRAHFPLPAQVTGSDAECAFAVVHRGLEAEGGIHEYGLPTFPSRRFVDASSGEAGLALVHDGLLEYEVIDDGRALALTLLRAVGFLSRAEPSLRPNDAGPTVEVAGAQLQGAQRAEYAVLLHRDDWRAADGYGAADALLVPFERTRAVGAGTRPAHGSALHVDGAEVSAVLREPGGLIVRVFRTDPGDGPVTIEHEGTPARGWIIDLRGRPVAPFEHRVNLRPWEICTLQLAET
jgi:alpha-mannosidase